MTPLSPESAARLVLPPEVLELGAPGRTIRFVAFAPDRSIESNAARFEGVADDPRAGAVVAHPGCELGRVYVGLNPAVNPAAAVRAVLEDDPLTLEGEVRCDRCGDAGSIVAGEWVPA